MGKNKRRQFECFDEFHQQTLQCDSVEEVDMLSWLNEAKKYDIVIDWKYQPKSFLLAEKADYINIDGKKKSRFREHIYSPDFSIQFNPRKFPILAREFKMSKEEADVDAAEVYVDVKGTFARNDGGRSFSMNQKWMFQRYNIYVYKLVPAEFFKVAGCPLECFVTRKTKKTRKMYAGLKSLKMTFEIK